MAGITDGPRRPVGGRCGQSRGRRQQSVRRPMDVRHEQEGDTVGVPIEGGDHEFGLFLGHIPVVVTSEGKRPAPTELACVPERGRDVPEPAIRTTVEEGIVDCFALRSRRRPIDWAGCYRSQFDEAEPGFACPAHAGPVPLAKVGVPEPEPRAEPAGEDVGAQLREHRFGPGIVRHHRDGSTADGFANIRWSFEKVFHSRRQLRYALPARPHLPLRRCRMAPSAAVTASRWRGADRPAGKRK